MGPALREIYISIPLRLLRAATGLLWWAKEGGGAARVWLDSFRSAWVGVARSLNGRDVLHIPVLRWRFEPRCRC